MKHNSSLAQAIRSSAFVLIAAVLMACQGETVAQTVDSSQFQDVKNPMKPSTGDKVEVVEMFWYGCGHCYALEPSVKKWQANKPENAELVRVPALFSKRWEFHGQAYYTMEALGVLEQAHEKFFEEIHMRRKQINNLSQLIDFLARFDKGADEVKDAFNSFGVDSKMRAARKITRDSGATGVPTLLVDGKYMTTETLTGGPVQLFNVIDQLVEKAAAER